jgi:hypothetical protein
MKTQIEAEIRRRADHYLPLTHLVVDYYRIRRRVAYPLPVREFTILKFPLPPPRSSDYPWATWMSWELEERIGSLGWAREWFGDAKAGDAAIADISALADWPRYRQYPQPDLSLGHTARTLWSAYTHWKWIGGDVKKKIEAAFARMVDDVLPFSEQKHGALKTKEDIFALKEPHHGIHNIHIIGNLGAALAAKVINHPAAELLKNRVLTILAARLDLQTRGVTEAVAYDGYVQDFVATWLPTLSKAEQAQILDHPEFTRTLDRSFQLSAPGNALQVAELSDVEPRQMTFHASVHSKCYSLRPRAEWAWYLKRCDLSWLRADGLAALREISGSLDAKEPKAGALDAGYVTVLRTGWESSDTAVAVSCNTSGMGHIHFDNGHILIGTQGQWLITDPGYQQYMPKKEREFTLGTEAHNVPVINGRPQTIKQGRRVALEQSGGGLLRTEIDMTRCYAPELKIESALRTVWLSGKNLIVVADRIRGEELESIHYHWLGHADAAWWATDGGAKLYAAPTTLWIRSPQAPVSDADIDRVPGSRGQLTLKASADASAEVIWWVFKLGESAPEIKAEGGRLNVDGVLF